MATISITDLPANRVLDYKAMARIRGADGAQWVFGWISPYVEARPGGIAPVFNFYQINNYADQMINQYQVVSVINSAQGSNLNVKVDESSVNNRLV